MRVLRRKQWMEDFRYVALASLAVGRWDIFVLFQYTCQYKQINRRGMYVLTPPRAARQVYNRHWPL